MSVGLLAIYFGGARTEGRCQNQLQDSTARFNHNPQTQVLDGETWGTLQWVFIL